MLRRQWVNINSVGVHWHLASTIYTREKECRGTLFLAYVINVVQE